MEDLPGRRDASCPSGGRDADQETLSLPAGPGEAKPEPEPEPGARQPSCGSLAAGGGLEWITRLRRFTPWFGRNFPGDSNSGRPRARCPQWTSARCMWTRGSCRSTGPLAAEFPVPGRDRHSGPRWGRVPRGASGPSAAVSRLPKEPTVCIRALFRS